MAGSTTMRFPEGLKAEATAYADSLGLSLNALCAVALRDYLDARRGEPAQTTPPEVAKPAIPPVPLPSGEVEKVSLGAVLGAAVPKVHRESKKRRKR